MNFGKQIVLPAVGEPCLNQLKVCIEQRLISLEQEGILKQMVFGLELQCPLFSESSTLEILDLPAHSSMIQFFKISPSHSSLSLYKYVHLYTYIKIYIHVFLIINDNYLSLIIL